LKITQGSIFRGYVLKKLDPVRCKIFLEGTQDLCWGMQWWRCILNRDLRNVKQPYQRNQISNTTTTTSTNNNNNNNNNNNVFVFSSYNSWGYPPISKLQNLRYFQLINIYATIHW
jgi:hypothetical protein